MNVRLSEIGHLWTDMLDVLADTQAHLLRRTAATMADELDRQAMREVEGARDWRDFQKTGNRYASR